MTSETIIVIIAVMCFAVLVLFISFQPHGIITAVVPVEIITFMFLAVIFIFIAVVNYRYYTQRTKAIKELANKLSFQYQPEPKSCLPSQIWEFSLFSRGQYRKFSDLIQGYRNGIKISIGDYWYTQGHGKQTITYSQTVVFVELNDLNLPSFELAPESMFDKVGNIFGFHDIDFETHPDFSRYHKLAGSDESGIRQLFHDDVLNFYQTRINVRTEGNGSMFIYYYYYELLPPDQWEARINETYVLCQYFTCKGY